MNRKSLQKIKDALLKESPNIEYALGILDTLMDSLPEGTGLPGTAINPDRNAFWTKSPVQTQEELNKENIDDEQAILDATARAKLADVMKTANESLG